MLTKGSEAVDNPTRSEVANKIIVGRDRIALILYQAGAPNYLGLRFLNSLHAMNKTAGEQIRITIPMGMSDGNLGRPICIIEFPSMKMPITRYSQPLFDGERAWAAGTFRHIKISRPFIRTRVATDENRIKLTGVPER